MAQPQPGGLRRRADKLRIIAWTNLALCVAVGLFLDLGEAALRWTAVAVWSLLLFFACHLRAKQMDGEGPVKRR